MAPVPATSTDTCVLSRNVTSPRGSADCARPTATTAAHATSAAHATRENIPTSYEFAPSRDTAVDVRLIIPSWSSSVLPAATPPDSSTRS